MHNVIIATCLGFVALGSGVTNASTVTLPGDTVTVKAPVGTAVLRLKDPGENADGIHQFSLLLYRGNRATQLLEFTRSVDVTWSPNGKYVAITDYIGSNVTDCLVVDVAKTPMRTVAMSSLIQRQALPGHQWNVKNSHYYVQCTDWDRSGHLDIKLNAIADNGVISTYTYNYDLRASVLNYVAKS